MAVTTTITYDAARPLHQCKLFDKSSFGVIEVGFTIDVELAGGFG